VEKFKVVIKKSSLKQLRLLPKTIQDRILSSVSTNLATKPYITDGKHIKKLTEGYRLRVGDYRIFYYIEGKTVTIVSFVRRTSTTY